MQPRELLRQFRESPWAGEEDVEAFLVTAGTFDPSDILKLVELVASRSAAQDVGWIRTRTMAVTRMVEAARDPALFQPLLRMFKSADGVGRQLIATLLPMVNSVQHHPELCALLQSNDPVLRKATASVLVRIGGRVVFEALATVARQPGAPYKAEAIDTLVAVGGHHALPVLSDVMRAGSTSDRQQALKYIREPRVHARDLDGAVEAARWGLADPEVRVQVDAIQTFAAIASEDQWFEAIEPLLAGPSIQVVNAVVEGLRSFDSPRSGQILSRCFRAGPHAVRLAVIKVVEALGSDNVLPLLMDGVNHANIGVRSAAANAITRLGTAGKLDLARTILWLLRARDPNIRRTAIDIAGKARDPHAELWPKLLASLRDDDWWVRERVIDVLIAMAGAELTRHVVAYLSEPSEVVRRYAVLVLIRLKDPQSLGALVRTAMEDTDWWVRETAIQAVAEIGDKRPVRHLVHVMQRDASLRHAIVDALGKLDAHDAAPDVAALLTDEADPELRLLILQVLGMIGGIAQADAVHALENDPDVRIAAKARDLLLAWNYQVEDQASVRAGLLGVLDRLLVSAVQGGADDLILEAGRPPYVKRRGEIGHLSDQTIDGEELRALIYPLLSEEQRGSLERLVDIDFSHELKSEGLRFRANVFHHMLGLAAVFRVIKSEVPVMEKLGLPLAAQKLGQLKDGLVLVGGPTGSGKSTTLAAIIDDINRHTKRHIITLEDPIEVVHRPKQCAITQREIGTHSLSFAKALRATLRQDPDVILVGEMRDLPTISFAVSAAETGHLVFGTVHTVSADTSVDRIINAFPSGAQPQVRSMLASSLRAVLCQYLLPRIDGGRVLALEIMLNSDAVANMIRKAKTFQIPSVIATSREQGMQAMDLELQRLVLDGIVTQDEAYMRAANKKDFTAALSEAQEKKKGATRPPGQPRAPESGARPPIQKPPSSVSSITGAAGGVPPRPSSSAVNRPLGRGSSARGEDD